MKRSLLWVVLLVSSACSSAHRGPAYEEGRLPAGVVAKVGSDEVLANFVARVAAEHRLSLEQAREHLVSEALLAQAARERFGNTGIVRVGERSAASRALLDQLRAQAVALGPPTDAELERLRAQRWMDLDRPAAVRVVHAVVIPKSPERAQAARAVAERIWNATLGAPDAAEFVKRAEAVDASGLDRRVEGLPYMTLDGRAVYLDPLDHRRSRPQQFDATFAAAAHAIHEIGQQSPVVQTPFGFHVIWLKERVPAEHYSLGELRARLANDVFEQRAREQLGTLSTELRERTSVQLSRNVEELTALLSEHR